MASESCKTLALFDYKFLCLKQGDLRSDGWTWYRNLGETLGLPIDSEVDDGCVDFSCDLMPVNLLTFNN